VPEGDTIHRSAATLRQWLAGRTLTAATSRHVALGAARLVGGVVTGVEAKGKHLLLTVDDRLVVHTHLGMTGSWRVKPAPSSWRRSMSRADIVLEAGDRHAACFDAPVVEVLDVRDASVRVADLGPDACVEPLDLGEVRRRAAALPAGATAGELLLDQRVVSGVGNVYRCEALFARRLWPWAPVADLGAEELDALVAAAAAMLRANLSPRLGFARDTGAGPGRPLVYGRAGRPCRRCGTSVARSPLGNRSVYWCPSCQASPSSPIP